MVEPPQPAVGDYAVLGDCRTAALVSRAGSVDWYCIPRFDGPSVFGALLDPDAGRFSVSPRAARETSRRYLPETNVLETTFRCPDGTVRLTDAMTVPRHPENRRGLEPDHEILRRVECLAGGVEVEVLCDPRVDYGRRTPAATAMGRAGVLFDGGADALVLASEIPLAPRAGAPGWSGVARLHAGDVRYLSLSSENAAPVPLPPLGGAAERRLDDTAGWWREWIGPCTYRGAYTDAVIRSMLTLKLLAFPPSGAIIAAVTTSLPEAPSGSRNWDYRYCWLRDASMTMEVLLHLGFPREAEAFLGWLIHATRLTRPELRVLYDVFGRAPVTETELTHLSGYRGARPVRVGNGAARQVQLDIYGELLAAARAFVEEGGRLDRVEGDLLAGMGETVCKRWRERDQGIWEVREPRRHWTLSKAMCWIALDCLLWLHDRGALRLRRPREEVEEEKAGIRAAVEERGWNGTRGAYAAWLDGEPTDAALLLLGIAGFEAPDGERMRRTLERVDEELGTDGLLYRYRYDDGQPGREGAFGICTFWRAELLARQGRVDEACRSFEHACSFANDVGLFAEQIDPGSGALWGNFPQAFTHIGLASAAKEIARARARPPEKPARAPESTEAVTRG
ncbi:MAG: glycoside hydrolase family 15 protein [Gemmatimonadota bacterium]|jgi:GH15 family glucan-1,4-alpha-glucosidase